MKQLPAACSMYEAVLLNISESTVETAISYYGKKYSFSKVIRYIDRLADNLAAEFHVRKGDTVTLCMPNSPAALMMFYAANKLGAIANLVHPFIPPEALKENLKKTNSKLLLIYDLYKCGNFDFGIPTLVSDSSYFMGAAAKLYYKCTNKRTAFGYIPLEKYLKNRKNAHTSAEKFDDNEAAVYLASGGTTGKPKIIVHNNKVFNQLCAKAEEFLSEPIENYRALYNVLPIFHGFGLCINMHMCMMMRRTNIMCIKFQPAMSAKQIVKEKANILTGVPTMFLKLLGEKAFTKADLSNIKDVYAGGDSVPQPLIDEFNVALKKGGSSARMYVGYGLTETVTVCMVNTRAHNRENSIGYPLSNTYVKIMKEGKEVPCGEVGEIYLLCDQFMLGYLHEEYSPFEMIDGEKWLKTGDYGYVDQDGFLYFKQRIKNMIKVSGVPVYPSEIEEAAIQVKGVAKVCAVGIADKVKGQVVRLFVECAEGTDEAACREEIMDICRRKLIAYAVPKEIVFEKKLPVSLIGKIDRKKLEERNNDITI